jgi:hypothetical protein
MPSAMRPRKALPVPATAENTSVAACQARTSSMDTVGRLVRPSSWTSSTPIVTELQHIPSLPAAVRSGQTWTARVIEFRPLHGVNGPCGPQCSSRPSPGRGRVVTTSVPRECAGGCCLDGHQRRCPMRRYGVLPTSRHGDDGLRIAGTSPVVGQIALSHRSMRRSRRCGDDCNLAPACIRDADRDGGVAVLRSAASTRPRHPRPRMGCEARKASKPRSTVELALDWTGSEPWH